MPAELCHCGAVRILPHHPVSPGGQPIPACERAGYPDSHCIAVCVPAEQYVPLDAGVLLHDQQHAFAGQAGGAAADAAAVPPDGLQPEAYIAGGPGQRGGELSGAHPVGSESGISGGGLCGGSEDLERAFLSGDVFPDERGSGPKGTGRGDHCPSAGGYAQDSGNHCRL